MELLQGTRNPSPTLTKEEAGQAAVRAMRQSERATARRYLRLFRWLLTGILALCLLFLLPHAVLACWHLYDRLVVAPKLGVIGSADTTTAIVTVSTAFPFWSWLRPLLLAAAALGVFLQVLVTENSRLVALFQTAALSGSEWRELLLLAAAPMAAHELLVWLSRISGTRHPAEKKRSGS